MGAVNSTEPLRIVMLGLDAVGKTSTLYRLKLGERQDLVIPTVGFNMETITNRAGVSFTMWDVGGGDKIRPLWKHYASFTSGIFFIMDSRDRDRFSEAHDDLTSCILEQDDFRGMPLIVLANKQDLPGAPSCEDIAEALGLYEIKNRKWHIQATSAVTGEGLYEALAMMGAWASEFRLQNRQR